MEYFPAALEKLVEQFARLPGIGGKSAQRLAFHVLSLTDAEAQEFADAIVEAKKKVTCCPICRNLTDGGLCPICASPKRDERVIVDVKVTRLAYGIPVGGHLEFADDATLMRALEGRREI